MNRLLIVSVLALATCSSGLAQQTADSPATKEDIQKYFQVTHARQMMDQMVDAMLKPLHQMIHEQYLKDKDKLPADFEERMSKRMDEMLRGMPWDEMLDAELPAFQKHLTKGDVDSLLAFYSSPTGQKMLREMPAMMSEAMESMMPILRKYMDTVSDRVQQEVAQMMKESEKKGGAVPATPN
ncbi:MAG TPA: DUF2059 domain-containing protein [Terriglobales bacterium]|nr:DUF2059 domain-containing protein [Terriglobales bacterium]